MEKFRKICAIIGLITAVIATVCSIRIGIDMIKGNEANVVNFVLSFCLSLLSYILAGGLMNMITSALGFIKYGFLVAPFPLSLLAGLAFAAVAVCIIPFFPIFFVIKSVREKGLLSV